MDKLFGQKISLGEADQLGWREANWAQAEITQSGQSASKSALRLVHISDTHICDAQSPARLAFTDRFSDPDHPYASLIGAPVGNYRSNEMLTTQVLAVMVETINSLRSPFSGLGVDVTVITGDLTDNAQENELQWVNAILSGGSVTPHSGARTFFGPGGEPYSEYYWNPGEVPDRPKTLFGFPTIPELLGAATSSFSSVGLDMPFVAVHGNHDLMLQGTVLPDENLSKLATGNQLPVDFASEIDLLALSRDFSPIGPTSWPDISQFATAEAHADASRVFLGSETFSKAFGRSTRYFAQEQAGFLLISLDTVNEWGGWDGSISAEQLAWLKDLLASNPGIPKLVFSHHPASAMENKYRPVGASERFGAAALIEVLESDPEVLVWLAGHDHRNKVHWIGKSGNLLHIETCSLIDWPQQGRFIEIFKDSAGDYTLTSLMFDHDSPASVLAEKQLSADANLAQAKTIGSISRELAGNHWQRRNLRDSVHNMEGTGSDRNFSVKIPRRS